MIKLAIVDQYWGFENSLIVDLIRSIAGEPVVITEPRRCDLLVVGPFRPPASLLTRAKARLKSAWGRDPWATRTYRPVIVFQNWENLRHDHIPADFSISSDLNVSSDKHLRLPYWLSQIDWSHEGLPVRHSPRVGRALSIERLMNPLGSAFLQKPKRAVLFTSHMQEPRRTLFDTLSKFVPTNGYGPAFDKTIIHHNNSPFFKEEILKNYAYNLCPENSLYPGYYTEKIPEAFAADTLPITWCDVNVSHDFNPDAFINLLPYAAIGYEHALARLLDTNFRSFVDAPLLLERPSLEPLRMFLRDIVDAAR